jgi:hypothetical protein
MGWLKHQNGVEQEKVVFFQYVAGRTLGTAAYSAVLGAAFYAAASLVTLPLALTPTMVAGAAVGLDLAANLLFSVRNYWLARTYAVADRSSTAVGYMYLFGDEKIKTSGYAERLNSVDNEVVEYTDFAVGAIHGFTYSGIGKIIKGYRHSRAGD